MCAQRRDEFVVFPELPIQVRNDNFDHRFSAPLHFDGVETRAIARPTLQRQQASDCVACENNLKNTFDASLYNDYGEENY
jgi:hypothetical protein